MATAVATTEESQRWLVDASAIAVIPRSPDVDLWSTRIQRGLVHISTVTRLEVAFTARNGPDLRRLLTTSPMSALITESVTPAIEARALEVMGLLADRGQHRAASIPDLLVAATAESEHLVVLHRDKDFELIAEITGQPLERID